MSQDDEDVDVGDYKPGSVQRIKLTNFLTYADVVVQPGPRLNMVCGPNGTGKSTILCAICLGLGGQPKHLGRADDARAFIMHEKNKATIEIELTPFPGQEKHILRRKIDRDKGSERGKGRGASSFYINGQKVNIQDVQDLVRETYHITIDNLCTFMPQEKVGNFSALDQQQLLMETEKTLSGTQHLYNTHLKLIDLEKELNTETNVESIEAKLAKLKSELERFEREKERMEEREEAIRQAELLQLKIVWLRFNDLRDKLIVMKEKRVAMKKQVKEAAALVAPSEQKAEALKEKRAAAEKEYKRLDQVTQKHKKEIEKQETKYQTHDDEIDSVLLELRDIDNKRLQKMTKLENARENLQKLQVSQQNLPPAEEVEATFEKAKDDKSKISQAYKRAKSDLAELEDNIKEIEEKAKTLSNKLSKLKDANLQRRQHILRQHKDLADIMKWLAPNRNNFRRTVWGPVAAEVTMKSENAAAFLEQHVPNAVLKSFIVECKEDYDLLYNEVRNKMKTPINIQLVQNGVLKPIKRVYSEKKFDILRKEHGIAGYMDESFDAPDAVKQALISAASVQKVLIGGDKTQQSIDERGFLKFLQEPDGSLGQQGLQGSCVCATSKEKSFKYTTEISRHSKKAFMRQDDIFPGKMLRMGGNDKQKKELEAKLQHYHADIDKIRPSLESAGRKKTELEDDNAAIVAKWHAAKQDRDDFIKIRTKVTNASRKVKDCEEDLNGDDKSQKRTLIQQAMSRISNSIGALEAHASTHNKMIKSTISSAGRRIDFDSLKDVERRAWQEYEEKQQEFEDVSKKASALNDEYNELRGKLAEAKREADNLAPLVDENGNALPMKEQLENLPVESLEEAQVALEEANQKVKAIHEDPNVVKHYEETVAAIEETEALLKEKQGSKDALHQKIEHHRTAWETAITNSISKVNILFGQYMREAQCVGEVRLTKGDTYEDGGEGNFKDWGVEIRVSFREGHRPQVLSARVQSGGERSVSTIFYLMALQEMMVAPFRCVDEINQGLDDRNERLVFRRIVENSTKPPRGSDRTKHSGQYFLITPKLLPNLQQLEESDGITVLIVYNGEGNFDSSLDWGRFLSIVAPDDDAGGKKRSSEEDENDENVENSSIPRRGKKRRS